MAMDLNARPALQFTRALLPGIRPAKFGRIINITSLVTAGLAFCGSYAAAFITGQTLFVDGGASFGAL
jgi:3-oxoacyl-[acyl-carrier protein] reductase